VTNIPILQTAGLTFPNIVAVLLLPIFIIPGIGGLKIRLYVARRSDNYGRLDSLVYSWSLSAISLLFLYVAVGVATNDFTLVPELLRVEDSTTGSETGLRIPYLLGLYAAHFALCLILGAVSGSFAYNFIDDVNITERLSKRELMLNRIAPGKEVVVRLKSGELFQGRVGSKWDTGDDEDLLLLSPTQLIDKDGETWRKENRGPYLYVDSAGVSRISLADSNHEENLDPESAIDDPDRLQSFIRSLTQELYPETTLRSILSPPRISITIGLLTGLVFSLLGGLLWTISYGYDRYQFETTVVEFGSALIGLIVIVVFQITIGRAMLRKDEARTILTLVVPASIIISPTLILVEPSMVNSFFHISPFIAVSGLLTGLLAIYVSYYYPRAKSPIAIVLLTISTISGLILELVHITPSKVLIFGNLVLFAVSVVWLFYVAIYGGPSKRQIWAKRLRRPVKILFMIFLITVMTITPWLFLTPDRPLGDWPILFIPYLLGISIAAVSYYVEVERISLNGNHDLLNKL